MTEQANIKRPEQQTEKGQAGDSASLTHGAELSRPGSNADYNAMKAKGGSTAQEYLPNNFTIDGAPEKSANGSVDYTKPGDNSQGIKTRDSADASGTGDLDPPFPPEPPDGTHPTSDKPPAGVDPKDAPLAKTWVNEGGTWVGLDAQNYPVAYYAPSDGGLLSKNPNGHSGWYLHNEKGGDYVQVDPLSIQEGRDSAVGLTVTYRHLTGWGKGLYILGSNDNSWTGEID